MRELIINAYPEANLLFADGFDEAILGIDEMSMKIIYSVNKIIDILEKDMCREDALEYFEYNIEGAFMGIQTPIYCRDYFTKG